jgi:hypothetical protein
MVCLTMLSRAKDRWSLMLGGGGGALNMRLITSPYKTIYINKPNDCCHIGNFEWLRKGVISICPMYAISHPPHLSFDATNNIW